MMRKITRLAERSEALKAMSWTLDFTQNEKRKLRHPPLARSPEEHGTARAGAGASSDSLGSSFLLHPSAVASPPPAPLDCVPEHFPHEHKIAASHITHKLWCELLVNEDLI